MDLISYRKIRFLLILIHVVVGLNALAGGYYGISGAPHVPVEWLEGSPFQNYFIPSLILLIVVGGSQLGAALAVGIKGRHARLMSAASGIILLIWIAVQVAIIGYVSWLQPAMALSGLTIIFLSGMIRVENKN